MRGLGSVWVPPRGLWDPSPPVGGKAPGPGPGSVPRWDPNPRWGWRSGLRRRRSEVLAGDPGAVVGWGRGVAPRARVRGVSGQEGFRGQKIGSNLAPFFRGASGIKKGSACYPTKPLIWLVEPTGIEPVTSTMPL